MKIVSWNVAGLRAMLKKDSFHEFMNAPEHDFDIICLQETKCEEGQAVLPDEIQKKYPFRYWNSTNSFTQRKGLSGTTIWSKTQPIRHIDTTDFDKEGRLVVLEFEQFILVNVYVPNSQKLGNERYRFREVFNMVFTEYLSFLRMTKSLIVCGDFNVAHHDIDITNPKQKKNRVPGFFDNERDAFNELLVSGQGYVDCFRHIHPTEQKYTYWSNFLKAPRSNDNGWRIDYFVVSSDLIESGAIKECDTMMYVRGSDHCPMYLEI
jgi:exodeoxyribonuclease III